MTPLPRRVRALGALLSLASVTRLNDEQLVARQGRPQPHHPALDRVFGDLAPEVTVTDTTTCGTEPVGLRVYRPRDAAGILPLVLLLHGGGWAAGTLDGYDWIGSRISLGARAVVVSVDYRLAPTHRWPTAAEDCYAALVDVVARAEEWGADPDRVALAGDSAGGNLAAVLALMARDRSGPPVRAQVLVYPSTDLVEERPSMLANAHAPVLTRAEAHRFCEVYVPDEADRSHPYASPLLAPDHTGLPAALVQVAEHDPLRDDGLAYAQALTDAGVPVRTTTYVGMPHGYLSFPGVCTAAPQAMAEITAFLRERLA